MDGVFGDHEVSQIAKVQYDTITKNQATSARPSKARRRYQRPSSENSLRGIGPLPSPPQPSHLESGFKLLDACERQYRPQKPMIIAGIPKSGIPMIVSVCALRCIYRPVLDAVRSWQPLSYQSRAWMSLGGTSRRFAAMRNLVRYRRVSTSSSNQLDLSVHALAVTRRANHLGNLPTLCPAPFEKIF